MASIALWKSHRDREAEDARRFQLISSLSAFVAGVFLLLSVALGWWDSAPASQAAPSTPVAVGHQLAP
jgi:hypothetical protein